MSALEGSGTRARSGTSLLEEREAARREAEYEQYLLRLKSLHRLAIAAWAAYAALDAFCAPILTTTPVSYFLAVRLAGFLAASMGLFVLSRWPSPPVWVARALDVSVLVVPSATVGLLCVWLGGITSPYTAGLGFILSCRAALMSERWPVATAHLLSAIVAFVGTILAISLYSEELARQLRDRTALVSATVSVSISVSVAVFAVIGGHTVWALRRAAFEGRDLGRVRLEAKIGEGAMGEVWRGFDTVLRRSVAVKVLQRPTTSKDAVRAHARFDREIKLLAAIDHPHVVRILDYGTTPDKVAYFTMDLLDGRDLADLVRREGRQPEHRVVVLAEQAARALAHAHARGIVHRDVKPSNVFVCESGDGIGHARLLDFGIAKGDNDLDDELTATGAFVGTPQYAAPEVLAGSEPTPAADVYGLAATMVYALTGSPPFGGIPASSAARARVAAELPSLCERGVSKGVDAIVRRGLRAAPEARFASADDMAKALRAILWSDLRTDGHAPDPSPVDTGSAPSTTMDDPLLEKARRREAAS